MWIMVRNADPPRRQKLDDLQRRRVSAIIDVFLEGNAEDKYRSAFGALLLTVQRRDDLIRNEVWHVIIDPCGELDEIRVKIVFSRLPRKEVGVNRNAVAAHEAWIEGHETVRLRRGCLHDLPNI